MTFFNRESQTNLGPLPLPRFEQQAFKPFLVARVMNKKDPLDSSDLNDPASTCVNYHSGFIADRDATAVTGQNVAVRRECAAVNVIV
jgi:hypothetical protein